MATDPGPNPIEVGFAASAPQGRLTVAFRLILVIPQAIVLYVLGIAAFVVAFVGWWAALFTGRLPGWAAEFLTGYLRWDVRVASYGLLLTDKYPPFSFEDDDYPVRLATRPGRLNRFAVFFRILLAIPAHVLAGVLAYGALTVVQIISWLIVLVTGRMPEALHQALSAVLRYLIRYDGYLLMLTSQQPFDGLFGDGDDPAIAAAMAPGWSGIPGTGEPPHPGGTPSSVTPEAAPVGTPAATDETLADTPATPATGETAVAPEAPAAEVPAAEGAAAEEPGEGPAETDQAPPGASWATPVPGAVPGGDATLAAGEPVPAAPGPAGEGAGWAVPGVPPWKLFLSRRARNLVGLFIGLGILLVIVYIVVEAVVVSSGVVSRVQALDSSHNSYNTLSRSMVSFSTKTQACQGSPNVLKCVTTQDLNAAGALSTFATNISAIQMPSGTLNPPAKASALATSSNDAAAVFRHLATAKSASQYQSIALSSNLQGTLSQVQQDYLTLITALGHP